jgi:hypothetical protein
MLCLGLLATAPVGSMLPGIILAVMALQMIAGRAQPVFPSFIMTEGYALTPAIRSRSALAYRRIPLQELVQPLKIFLHHDVIGDNPRCVEARRF